MNQALRKNILRFAKLVENSGIKNPQVIVYGSHAKGKAKPFSDIDVCIVADKFGKNPIKNEVKLRLLALKVDERIDPIVYLKKDFLCEEDPLAFEIKKYGIKIN